MIGGNDNGGGGDWAGQHFGDEQDLSDAVSATPIQYQGLMGGPQGGSRGYPQQDQWGMGSGTPWWLRRRDFEGLGGQTGGGLTWGGLTPFQGDRIAQAGYSRPSRSLRNYFR